MVDVDARLAEIEARAEMLTAQKGIGFAARRIAREDVPWLLAVLKEQADRIERLQREATADAVARSGGGPGAFEARMRDALGRARRFHGALNMAIDDGDDYGEHVGMQRHRRAVSDGQCEILRIWEDALEPLPEPPPLPPRIYGEESRDAELADEQAISTGRGMREIHWRDRAEALEDEVTRLEGELADAAHACYLARLDTERERAEVTQLRAALAFYASESTYEETAVPHPARFASGVVPIETDYGALAREALRDVHPHWCSQCCLFTRNDEGACLECGALAGVVPPEQAPQKTELGGDRVASSGGEPT